MGPVKKEIAIGVLVSTFATFAGAFLYMEFFSQYDFEKTIQMLVAGKVFGMFLTLAAIPNLFVFFVFIKKKQDYRARGVLLATILIALFTFALKFMN